MAHRWNRFFSTFGNIRRLRARVSYPIALAVAIPFISVRDGQGHACPVEISGASAALIGGISACGIFFSGYLFSDLYNSNKMTNDKVNVNSNKMEKMETISDDIQFSYGWSGVHAGVTAKWTKNNNNLVSLSGLAVIVGSVTNADGQIATLPLNARPMYHVYTTALDCAGQYTRIYVSPNGSISVHGGFTDNNPNQITNWISLEGISFYTN
eukprot:86667_1